MHAVMRRMPAERVHHAKRLGHVQPAAFPVLAGTSASASTLRVTTPSSSLSIPTPSLVHSSSSAPPSSSTTPSSAPSSATTLSVASSTGLQSLTTTVSFPSLVIPSVPLPSASSTSSSTSSPPSNASAISHSVLSGGAIAGIIAGAAVVGAVLIMFLVRKTALRRREHRRISWSGAPGVGAGIFDELKPLPDTSEPPAPLNSMANPQWAPPPSPFEPHGQPIYSTSAPFLAPMQPATYPAYAAPTPPPATYNNPTAVTAHPSYRVPMTYGPGSAAVLATARMAAGTGAPPTLSPARVQQGPLEATVKCTFVPTLPDELSITTGERIFVIEEYDDSWDLCANVRGERGMVPRECLDHAPIDQSATDWRNTGRSSSLNLDGNRY